MISLFKKLKNYKVLKPCLKQSVLALIISKDGDGVFGSNSINVSIESCPRSEAGFKTGEGYHLCKDICKQNAHAEVSAILKAKELNIDIKGSSLYLLNHTYCCDNCISSMKDAGLKDATIFNDFGEIIKKYNLKDVNE